MIEKRGDKWAVVHGHAEPGHPVGSVIAMHDTYEEALAQHRAIEASKARHRKGQPNYKEDEYIKRSR